MTSVLREVGRLGSLAADLLRCEEETYSGTVQSLNSVVADLLKHGASYVGGIPAEDVSASFVGDLMLETLRVLEQQAREATQRKKLSIRNPSSVTTGFLMCQGVHNLLESLENVLGLQHLVAWSTTEAQYLTTTKEACDREQTIEHSQQVARGVQRLLALVTRRGTLSSEDMRAQMELEAASILQETSLLHQQLEKILPGSQTELTESLSGSVQALLLFAKHVGHNDEDSVYPLQQARFEFIRVLSEMVLAIYRHQSSSHPQVDRKSSAPSQAQLKRGGIRVVTRKQSIGSASDGADRSVDVAGHLCDAKQAQVTAKTTETFALFQALKALDVMRAQAWFSLQYEKEERDSKATCLRNLSAKFISLTPASLFRVSPRQRRHRALTKLKAGPTIKGTILGDIQAVSLSRHPARPRIDIRSMSASTEDLAAFRRDQIAARSISSPRKRFSLSNGTIIESAEHFRLAILQLLKLLNVELPTKIDLTAVTSIAKQCRDILQNLLLFANMQRNEDAMEPPSKMEQNEILNSMQDLENHVAETDQDVLRAIGRLGGCLVSRYILEEVGDLALQLESITVSLSSQVNRFHASQDRSDTGIFSLMTILRLFMQKLRRLIQSIKSYNFATSELDPTTNENPSWPGQKPFWEEIVKEMSLSLEEVPDRISVNQLIASVTAIGPPDVPLQNIFVRCYLSFMTDSQLLSKLEERMDVPESSPPSYQHAIQRSVYRFMSVWIESESCHLDPSDAERALRLLQMVDHPMNAPSIDLLKLSLAPPRLEVHPSTEFVDWQSTRTFMELSDDTIANQLTLIDFRSFEAIHSRELIQAAWSQAKLRYRSIHVRQVIDRQNQLAFWIASMIVLGRTPQERAKIWEKWISVGAVSVSNHLF